MFTAGAIPAREMMMTNQRGFPLNTQTLFRAACVPALCVFLAFAAPALAAKPAPAKAMDTVKIHSGSAAYNMADEVFTIDGDVTIESKDIKVTGTKLTYNNKTHVASLTGKPVTLNRGAETTLKAGSIQVNFDDKSVKARDGIDVMHKDKTVSLTVHCTALDLNYDTGDLVAQTGVDLLYEDISPDKPGKKAGDKQAQTLAVATNPARVTAGKVYYNYKNGEVRIPGLAHVALPELSLDASGLTGSFKKKYLEINGGIQAAMDDMTVTAGRATVDYAKRFALLEKDVRATRGKDVMTGERVEIDYTPKKGSIRVKGPVNIQLQIPEGALKNQKKQTPDAVPDSPEPR